MTAQQTAQHTEAQALDTLIQTLRFQIRPYAGDEAWGNLVDTAMDTVLSMTLPVEEVQASLEAERAYPRVWLLGTTHAEQAHLGFGAVILLDTLPGGGKLISVPRENATWNLQRLASCWNELAVNGIFDTAMEALQTYAQEVTPFVRARAAQTT